MMDGELAVKAQGEADSAIGFRAVDRHRSRPEFHLEKRALLFSNFGTVFP